MICEENGTGFEIAWALDLAAKGTLSRGAFDRIDNIQSGANGENFPSTIKRRVVYHPEHVMQPGKKEMFITGLYMQLV